MKDGGWRKHDGTRHLAFGIQLRVACASTILRFDTLALLLLSTAQGNIAVPVDASMRQSQYGS
jgi:hypothetical protein